MLKVLPCETEWFKSKVPIAIIPARGGSKRIPKKNIRKFLGRPILEITIEKARECGVFSQIYVSTDDQDIAELAESSGANVLMRSADLSDDFTKTIDVMFESVRRLELDGLETSDSVTCLYPVSPLLDFRHIVDAQKKLEEFNDAYVFAAQEQTPLLARSFGFDSHSKIKMLFPELEGTRTQDLARIFSDAGLFYTGLGKTWLKRTPIFSRYSKIIEIGRYESIDIDTESDWQFAEELFKMRNSRNLGRQ